MSKNEVDMKNTGTEITNSNDENEVVKYFKDEENELVDAIKEIDDLYDEVKEHYDSLKKASRSANGGRGILSFIEKQTSNLVTLKNSKASLINSKITLKKYEADLILKQKKDMDDSKVNNDIVNAILDKIEGQNENIVYEDDYNETSNYDMDEEKLLEERINSLKETGDIKDTVTDEYVDKDNFKLDTDDSDRDDVVLAVYIKNKKWSFVGINDTGKIVKGYEVPDKKGYKMRIHKEEDGTSVAIDQNDRIYTIIRAKTTKKKKKKE